MNDSQRRRGRFHTDGIARPLAAARELPGESSWYPGRNDPGRMPLATRGRRQHGPAAVAGAVAGALEQEKARISRELHDEVVQSLFAMKIDCAWLTQNLARDPARALQKVAAMQRLLEGSAASVRRIAIGLRPRMLEEAGFARAIEWLARDFGERTGAACEVRMPAGLDVPEPLASTAFRIVQEALANVRKHAAASCVLIELGFAGDALALAVRDDGKGFRADDALRSDAMGLAGLRERAALVGGDVDVTSAPGAGTRVAARLPLTPARAVRAARGNQGDAHACL